MYWGFYSFAIGLPVFLLWVKIARNPGPKSFSISEAGLILLMGLLLYASHILWLAAGIGYIALSAAATGQNVRSLLIKAVYLVPVVAAAALWYTMFVGSSMATPPLWLGLSGRISFYWWMDSALGGISGPAESVFFGAALLWIAAGALQWRYGIGCNQESVETNANEKNTYSDGESKNSFDVHFLIAGLLFLVWAAVLPDKYMNTIRFAQRWVPPAMVLLLLAVPAPRFKGNWLKFGAWLLPVALILSTTLTWKTYEQQELSGLHETLLRLPDKPKALGLSFIKDSELVKGRPFIQVFAYSQVLHGGQLNFSFSEFSPCLVVYKNQFIPPFTSGLEWFPERVRESDLKWFTHAIINGNSEVHDQMAKKEGLSALTSAGRWRLYEITPVKTNSNNGEQETN